MQPKGLKEHLARLNKLAGSEMIRVAGAVVFEASDAIRVEAFRSISAGSVSGAGHVASKPGEAPNRDTGDLQAGLENIQTGPLTAEVRATAAHSAPLEFGAVVTNGFGKGIKITIAARPFMRPARDKEAPKAQKRMTEQMSKFVKRSG